MERARTRALASRAGWQAAANFELESAFQRARGRVARWWTLEIERRRLFNWSPAAMAVGVLLYFAADREPGLAAPLIGLALASALAVVTTTRPGARMIAIAMAFVFLGFAAGVWRTMNVAAPTLERTRAGTVTGFVESVEHRTGGARLVLIPTGFADLAAEALPARIRVTTAATSIQAGDHVSGAARLLPPPGPDRPGGYDFARDAFFRSVGAVGSIPGALALAPAPRPPSAGMAWTAGVDRARNALTERIASAIGGQAGAVAAALVTGKRGLISEDTNAALRAAGIYHVVSISGLHMVMAAGSIFWLVRAVLALSTTAALFWPVKQIAALAAMAGATAYCLFSGSEVATERSLIMTLVMLGAILVGRPALSMRNLAISALLVLLREPETLLGPSFQMSFGAVAALIAFAERHRERTQAGVPKRSLGARALHWIGLAILADLVTTLLATAATAPFGIFHFQTINPFGLLGNALALPFVSFVVMPSALAGVLLYPFGLDAIAWLAMGAATKPVLALAAWVQGFAGSVLLVPAFGVAALVLIALALAWLTLWTTPIRALAILPLGIGIWLAAHPDRYDGFVDRGGTGAAIRTATGKLAILGRPSNFTLAHWLQADGDKRPPADPTLRAAVACDADGCVLDLGEGRAVAYSRTRRAVAEDCARASLVLTPLYWHGSCAAPMVDRAMLDRDGALALIRTPQGWSTIGARTTDERPWHGVRSRADSKPKTLPHQRSTQTAPSASPDDPSAGADLRDQ